MADEGGPLLLEGDCRDVLPTLEAGSVHCCVTSPPYWGLRDYGVEGQIGLEAAPEEHVAALVAVFREVRRVLRDDGVLWLNYGDAYFGGAGSSERRAKDAAGVKRPLVSCSCERCGTVFTGTAKRRFCSSFCGGVDNSPRAARPPYFLKPKDLIGMPWMVAFALRADGWYLRCDCIWSKPNPMPESVTDRPTRAHEYLFLFSKRPRYYYDADAIREPHSSSGKVISWKEREYDQSMLARGQATGKKGRPKGISGFAPGGRNKRSVWTITTQPTPEAHFATFPEKLVEPCILAGTSERGCCPHCGAGWVRVVEARDTGRRQKMADGWDTGEGGHGTIHRNGRQAGESGKAVMESVTTGWQAGCRCPHTEMETVSAVVLDPFGGAGTVGKVATRLGRQSVLIELNPDYVKIAEKRNSQRGLLL